MTEPRFVHLRMHTEYSVTDGITRIDPAIHKVAKDGGVALGITDLMNVFGGLRFYTHAQAAGLKPVMGCDIKVKNSGFPDNPYRMALLCMNHTGYHSLCELLTRAFLSKDDEYRGQIEEVWFDEEGATAGLSLLTGPRWSLGTLDFLRDGKNGSCGARAMGRTLPWATLCGTPARRASQRRIDCALFGKLGGGG